MDIFCPEVTGKKYRKAIRIHYIKPTAQLIRDRYPEFKSAAGLPAVCMDHSALCESTMGPDDTK